MYSLLIENDRPLKDSQGSRENHKNTNLIRVFNGFKHLSDLWYAFCASETSAHDQDLTNIKSKLTLVHEF
jgi:hypothetical protein